MIRKIHIYLIIVMKYQGVSFSISSKRDKRLMHITICRVKRPKKVRGAARQILSKENLSFPIFLIIHLIRTLATWTNKTTGIQNLMRRLGIPNSFLMSEFQAAIKIMFQYNCNVKKWFYLLLAPWSDLHGMCCSCNQRVNRCQQKY